MKAAIYLRVSTDEQDEENQLADCQRMADARGWEVQVFREIESGAKRRPVWDQLKTSAHRAEVGAVIVWALDRAGRDRVRLAHDIAEFARKGVATVSAREPWLDQPAGPMRDLLIELMAWFAEAERARLIERTRAGQKRAWDNGAQKGRPCLGLRDRVDLVECYDRGESAYFAAKNLGLPESTVRLYYGRIGKVAESLPDSPRGTWRNSEVLGRVAASLVK